MEWAYGYIHLYILDTSYYIELEAIISRKKDDARNQGLLIQVIHLGYIFENVFYERVIAYLIE